MLSFSGPRWWTLAMRALSALLVVLAATVTFTACSGPGPAGHGRPRAAPPASPQTAGCDQITPQVGPPGRRPVLITVPETGRRRAGIGWGNNLGAVSSLRLLSCPRQLGAWNVYAGGFYLRSPSGCVRLVFHIGRQTVTLSFAIGSGNCGSATW